MAAMATLYVRNVPDELYERLKKNAEARNSSISTEAVRLLDEALKVDREGFRRFIERVEASPIHVRPGAPSAAELIRRDREAH
jgi:plasmid stability protein